MIISSHLTTSDATSVGYDQTRLSGSRRNEKATPAHISVLEVHEDFLTQEVDSDGTCSHREQATQTSAQNVPRDIASLKAHNSQQPIMRLNADILEYLFLFGASLASSSPCSATSHPPSSLHHYDALTRTVLNYAQLTSSLRDVAMSSPRLWAHLVDFENASDKWIDELLRRSEGVSLEIVFQWSKALGATPHKKGLVKQREDDNIAKRRKLEGMLQYSVLSRARTFGIAVPAPHFAGLLLDKLSNIGGISREGRFDRLESLRIIRSRPRRTFIEEGWQVVERENGEGEDAAGYVPFSVLTGAPRLRELAIAESTLPFHDLLPLFAQGPRPPSYGDNSSITITSNPVLRTLYNLQSLHIADLPLHLAPSAREWLTYLCMMPALEDLILEGAMLGSADLGERAAERLRLRGQTDTPVTWDDLNEKDVQDAHIPFSQLPRIRVLTLDAALEDVALIVAALPLPFSGELLSPHFTEQRVDGRQDRPEWTMRCAEAHAGEVEGLTRVMEVFARASGGLVASAPRKPSYDIVPTGTFASSAALRLALSSTQTDVFVEQRSAPLGASFTVNLHLHISPPVPQDPSALNATLLGPAETLVYAVLGHLEASVMSRVTRLDVDIPPCINAAPLRNALVRAGKVARLGLAQQGAACVLKLLRNSGSVCDGASSTSSASSPGSPLVDAAPKVVLLPALKVLALPSDAASGLVWTALLRCIKARRADAPIATVRFAAAKTVRDAAIISVRVTELQGLGVGLDAVGEYGAHLC